MKIVINFAVPTPGFSPESVTDYYVCFGVRIIGAAPTGNRQLITDNK